MAILYIPIDANDEIASEEIECNECMHSLKGYEPGGNCPTCRYPILSTIGERPILHVDQRGLIADERIICINCHHSLRGISPAANCPECGYEALRSAGEGLLQFAPVEWLKTIRAGIAGLLLVVGLFVVAFVIMMGLVVAKVDQTTILLLSIGIGLIVGAVRIAAVFMTTAPCERASLTAHGDPYRAPVRALVIFTLIIGVALAIPAKMYPMYSQFAGIPQIAITVATWTLIIFYVSRLVEVVPDLRLAKKLRAAGKWNIGFGSVLTLGYAMSMIGGFPMMSAAMQYQQSGGAATHSGQPNFTAGMNPIFWSTYLSGAVLGCIGIIACLIIFIYSFILVWKMRTYAGKALQAVAGN